MASGSLLVPIKALVLNMLSLTATFGAMVWIFQDGNLSDVLGFTATGAFGTSGVSVIKMFGIGLGIAVLMDAFVIRGTLVPAFMKLAGNANWWAPAPLRRLHARFGLHEGDGAHAVAPAGGDDDRVLVDADSR